MIKENSKKKLLEYTFYYNVIFLLGFAYIFIERRSLIGANDSFNQNYCAFCYLGKWLRDCFSGNIRLYDTSIGLGESVIGSLNCYGIGDVLLIPFVLFPERFIHYGYTLSIVFRLYLAGLSFLFYSSKQKDTVSGLVQILASFFYVFSAYTMTNGLLFPGIFITALVWFPLIALGVESLLDDTQYEGKEAKRSSILLIISVFFLSLIGFYFIYMVILYVAVKVIISESFGSKKYFFRKCFRIITHFALGMGCACAILLPAVKYFLNSSRSGSVSLLAILLELPNKETVINGIRNIVTPSEGIYDYMALSLPVITILCLIVLLTHKEISKRKEMICGVIVCIYGYFIPAVGTIMNGGARHYDRWLFLAFFFFACLFMRIFPVLISSTSKMDEIISWGLFLLWIVSYWFTCDNDDIKLKRIFFYSFLWVATILTLHAIRMLRNKKIDITNITRALYVLCFANVVLNVFLVISPGTIGGAEAKNIFLTDVRGRYTETPIYWEAENYKEKALWGRYDMVNSAMLNEPMVCGISSTSGHYSILNGSIAEFLGDFGIVFPVRGLDSRQVLESLLCVYRYSYNGWGSWTTEENDYFLPLGVIYDGFITKSEYQELSVLERQNALMSAVVLEDGTTNDGHKKAYTGEVSIIPSEIVFEDVQQNEGSISVKSGSKIQVQFTPDESIDGKISELYLVIKYSGISGKIAADVGDTHIELNRGKQEYPVCVDYLNDSGNIDIIFKGNGDINLESIQLINNYNPRFVEDYDYLNTHRLFDAKWEGDSYKGVSNEEKNGYLFMSLPFLEGWKCTIDGVDTKILCADKNFMAVCIPSGEHLVEFSYHTPWFKEGIVISIISLLVTILLFCKKDIL